MLLVGLLKNISVLVGPLKNVSVLVGPMCFWWVPSKTDVLLVGPEKTRFGFGGSLCFWWVFCAFGGSFSLLVGLFVHLVRKVHWAPRRDTRHFFIGHLGACAGRCSAALSLILICRFVISVTTILVEHRARVQLLHLEKGT